MTKYLDFEGNEIEPQDALIRLHDGREQVKEWRGFRVPWARLFKWGIAFEMREVFVRQRWTDWEVPGRIHRIIR